ncbi:hypothetical protein [Sorangium sp. So ce388]
MSQEQPVSAERCALRGQRQEMSIIVLLVLPVLPVLPVLLCGTMWCV